MGFIGKQLTQGTAAYFFWTLYAGLTTLTFLDMFYKITPHGETLYLTAIITIGGLGWFLGHKNRVSLRQRRFDQALKTRLAEAEKKREEEIRRIYAETPEFATHCFQCAEYNHRVAHCGRNLETTDPMKHHVRFIRIGPRQFCLYWRPMEELPPDHFPENTRIQNGIQENTSPHSNM